MCVQVLVRAFEPLVGTHQSVVNIASNSRVLTDLLQRTLVVCCLCGDLNFWAGGGGGGRAI